MARIVGITDHTITLIDGMSGGDEFEMTFRMPTTSERVQFRNESFPRKGKDIKNNSLEARIKFGLKILTGIPNKYFGRMLDGQVKYVSSEKGHPDYDPDWKDVVGDVGSDLVEVLAIKVFELGAAVKPDESEDDSPKAEGEDEEDLEKN